LADRSPCADNPLMKSTSNAVVVLSITLCLLASACSKPSSPTTPDPPPAPSVTRIIRLGGDLNFGYVSFVDTKEKTLTVSNDGNDTLQVTGLSGPCGGSTYLTVPGATAFTVAPGGTVPILFRFAPRVRITCSGTVTVFGNQTSGSNTLPLTATGVLPGCDLAPPDVPLPPSCFG